MTCRSIRRRFFGVFLLLRCLAGAADEPAIRADSLGPLERGDPNATPIEEVIFVLGDPHAGFPAKIKSMRHRLPDGDRWYVECGRRLCLMELDRKSGTTFVRDTIKADDGAST